MTVPDQADDAAAAARRAHFDELKRVAFSRPTSPEETVRAAAAQAELAREDARVLAEESLAAAVEARAADAYGPGAPIPAEPERRRPWLIPLAAVAAVAVVAALIGGGILVRGNALGDAGGTATNPSPAAATPRPTPPLPTADPDLEETVADELGEAPPDQEYTPEQVASALALTKEEGWNNVLTNFPNAVRPEATLIRTLENDEYIEVVTACLSARGVPFDIAIGGNGLGFTLDTEEHAVGHYLCSVEYPSRPRGLSAAQVAYVYEYFVQFKAPCLEKLGYPQESAPTKDAFVSGWPRQGWNPHYSFDAMLSEEEIVAVEAACPSYPKGIN